VEEIVRKFIGKQRKPMWPNKKPALPLLVQRQYQGGSAFANFRTVFCGAIPKARSIKMSTNILVVDDEKELADVLELYLTNDGFTVYKCYTGAEALDCIAHTDLDLAILDVMLPDVDGFQLCRKIRETSYYPVIMLTAKVADGDKIMGLTIGADDYITKPFNPLEVVARVKTQLRRYRLYNHSVSDSEEPAHEYDIRGLTINKDNHNGLLNKKSGELPITAILPIF